MGIEKPRLFTPSFRFEGFTPESRDSFAVEKNVDGDIQSVYVTDRQRENHNNAFTSNDVTSRLVKFHPKKTQAGNVRKTSQTNPSK